MAITPPSPADGASDSVNDAANDATVQRLSFLATAGEVLSSSLDYDQTLREVARLALHVLGDFCVVDLVEDGALRRVVTAHVLPDKAALLVTLRDRYPLDGNSWQPVVRVMRTGRLEFLEQITPEQVAAHARSAEHAALLQAVGVRTHIAAPLIARGEIIGVIGFGISDSDRRYRPTDISLAQDLARRAALAIDNARLYRRAETELAERRHAEDALRFSEERFRAILEQSPLAMQLLTPEGYTLRVNRAWEELWGLTVEQLRGYSILDDPQLIDHGITPLLRRAMAGDCLLYTSPSPRD